MTVPLLPEPSANAEDELAGMLGAFAVEAPKEKNAPPFPATPKAGRLIDDSLTEVD